MFYWKMIQQVERARRNLEAVEASIDKAMDSAETEAKRHDAWSQYDIEYDVMQEEYRLALTQYWIKMARDKFVPRPAINKDLGYWEQTHNRHRWVLTDEGISHLRSGIRQEVSSSNETYFKWAAIILGVLAVAVRFIP